MRRVTAGLPILDPTYRSYLIDTYTSGTDLYVLSNVSFAASDFIVVGQPGEERTELKQVNTPSGDDLLTIVSDLKNSHTRDTAVYKSIWDTVVFEANLGSGFAVISQSAIQWDNPQKVTVLFHEAGTNTTEYRFRFYNSSILEYGEYSPTVTGSAPFRNSVAYMVKQVRQILNDPLGDVLKNDEIIRGLNDAQEIIYGNGRKWWFLRFTDSSITTTANTTTYNLDALGGGTPLSPGIELGYIDDVRFRINDGTQDRTYPLRYQDDFEFDLMTVDNLRQSTDSASYYSLLPPDVNSTNGYISLADPALTTNGTLYIRAFKKIPDLVNVSDRTLIPIPSIIENYVIGKGFRVTSQADKAKVYEDLFFGTPPSLEKTRPLTGIALLENLNQAQTRPKQPRSLVTFRGRRKFYGNRGFDYNDYKELHLGD